MRGSEPPELGRSRTTSLWLNKSSCSVDERWKSQEDTTDYEQGEQKFWFIPVTQCQNINYHFKTSDKKKQKQKRACKIL